VRFTSRNAFGNSQYTRIGKKGRKEEKKLTATQAPTRTKRKTRLRENRCRHRRNCLTRRKDTCLLTIAMRKSAVKKVTKTKPARTQSKTNGAEEERA